MAPWPTIALAIALELFAPSTAPRTAPTGAGPHLAPVATPTAVVERRVPRRVATYIDVTADVYVPGKADPSEWMSTGTWARITYDGINYQYGYDPLAQTFDMSVSGLAEPQYGILLQETVGIMAIPLPVLPGVLEPDRIERVDVHFRVKEHNLFPNEGVGITALTDDYAPRGDLNSLEGRLLYEDARGFTGAAYALDHFAAGPHAIDLGALAVEDMARRMATDGWFGVGFAADGWDLSGSLGQTVFWKVDGGGGLPEVNRPFFRIQYNAAPSAPSLVHPPADAVDGRRRPRFVWNTSIDPNLDAPLSYRVMIGDDPLLTAPIAFDAGTDTTVVAPVDLGPGIFYWAVEASDPFGATRRSGSRRLVLEVGTDAPSPVRDLALRAAPNPFNPRTALSARLPHDGTWTLEVFDPRGRLVRRHVDTIAAGEWVWVWDGTDDAGAPVASGVYGVRLRDATHSTATHARVTLVR